MIEVHTRREHDTGDVWVEASYRLQRGEVAVYQVRVPYLDTAGPDKGRNITRAGELARHRLERMLRDYRGY